MPQAAGGAEVEHLAVEAPVEGQRRIAQRAVGDRDRHASHCVVHDLVPDEDLQGVGPGVAFESDDDHGLTVPQPTICFANGLEAGLVDGRDAVLGRPARNDLLERDTVLGEIGVPVVAVLRCGGLRERKKQA